MIFIIKYILPQKFQRDYIRSFRQIIKIFFFGIIYTAQRATKTSEKWEDCNDGFELYLSTEKFFKLEVDHFYYDGPHCFYHFGPIKFFRYDNWKCKKCLGEDV